MKYKVTISRCDVVEREFVVVAQCEHEAEELALLFDCLYEIRCRVPLEMD